MRAVSERSIDSKLVVWVETAWLGCRFRGLNGGFNGRFTQFSRVMAFYFGSRWLLIFIGLDKSSTESCIRQGICMYHTGYTNLLREGTTKRTIILMVWVVLTSRRGVRDGWYNARSARRHPRKLRALETSENDEIGFLDQQPVYER